MIDICVYGAGDTLEPGSERFDILMNMLMYPQRLQQGGLLCAAALHIEPDSRDTPQGILDLVGSCDELGCRLGSNPMNRL